MTSLRFLLLINSFNYFTLFEQFFFTLIKLIRSIYNLYFSFLLLTLIIIIWRFFFNDWVILINFSFTIRIEIIPFICSIWCMNKARSHSTWILFTIFNHRLFYIQYKYLIYFFTSTQTISCCCNYTLFLFNSF